MSKKNRDNRNKQIQNAKLVGTEPPPTGRIVIPTKAEWEATLKNAPVQPFVNGLCDAVGFGAGGPGIGGFPGTQPFGFTGQGFGQPVEETTTAFENLRWYLVSNFRQLLSQCFVEIGLVKTICVVPVQDGLRGGAVFKSKQLGEQNLSELKIEMDRKNDIETAGWGSIWTRLYGGGGILALTGDQDPLDPLDIDAIKEGDEIDFRAVDMWELYWDKQNVEGYDAGLEAEDFEFYNYYAEPVHKSRVMRLKGLEAPSFVRPRLRGWGLSEVETLIRSMNQYLKATALGFEVLDEFKLDVYKIKNLVNTLLGPGGTQQVQQRVGLANWQKSYQNAVVMDSEDDFDHKQLSFAGLAEAMQGIRQQVAADMRMPIIKLFGQSVSSGGLGTSSVEEMENYNAMVESEVRNKLKWHILRMGEMRCMQLFGMVPDDLEIEFKPLRELTAEQQENVKKAKFERVAGAKASGDMTTKEYRDACNKGQLFDIHMDTEATGLDPSDPELQEVASGERSQQVQAQAAQADDDGEDTGPDDDTASEDKKNPKDARSKDSNQGANESYSRKLKVANIMRESASEKIETAPWHKRLFANSPEFDKASYEADGGDSWIADGRKELFTNPGDVDEALWKKAKDASQKAFGRENWKFVTWFYKKQGGRFT